MEQLMNNKSLLVLFLLIFCNTLKGQVEIPGIIAIDGTLPKQLNITAITSNNDTLEFSYFRSHFSIQNYVYNKITDLPDNSVLLISINFTEFHYQTKTKKKTPYKKTYYFNTSLSKNILFGGDILISITTFDKLKTTYYIDWQGNGIIKHIDYNKSWGNRRKAYKRILSIYPDNDQ